MSPIYILATGVGVALAASSFTVLAIRDPLRRQLDALCANGSSGFWMRAAVTVIYLVPLFIVLTFGMPDLTVTDETPAEIVRRTIAASAFALAAIVIAIGLRLSSLRPRP